MKIVDDKALLLTLRNPSRVTAVIPKSKELPNNQVLVNWGLEETQVLRNMNINAPSPIESRYEWSGRYAPFDHQGKLRLGKAFDNRSGRRGVAPLPGVG